MRDWLLDDNNDLDIREGDFALGDSEVQDAALIVQSEKAWWRQHPLLGFAASRWVAGSFDRRVFNKELSDELALDGFRRAQVQNDGDTIYISARRNGPVNLTLNL